MSDAITTENLGKRFGEVVAVEGEPVPMFGWTGPNQTAGICNIGEDTLPLP